MPPERSLLSAVLDALCASETQKKKKKSWLPWFQTEVSERVRDAEKERSMDGQICVSGAARRVKLK